LLPARAAIAVAGRRRAPGLAGVRSGSVGQGGLLLYRHGHQLARAFVSGRLAGRHAALAEQGRERRAAQALGGGARQA